MPILPFPVLSFIFNSEQGLQTPSHGGLEVEHPLRIQLKAGHSYLGGFKSRLGHGYVDVICNLITLCNNPQICVICIGNGLNWSLPMHRDIEIALWTLSTIGAMDSHQYQTISFKGTFRWTLCIGSQLCFRHQCQFMFLSI